MNITLRQLEIFNNCASTLHFAKAAEQLFMSPPAVTKQIQNLESQLNVKLFDLIGKKIQLTHEGELFKQKVKVILQHMQDLKAWAQQDLAQQIQPIIFSFSPAIGNTLFSMMDCFKKSYPAIPVIYKTHTDHLLPNQKLKNHEIDAYIHCHLPKAPWLDVTKVMNVPFYWVGLKDQQSNTQSLVVEFDKELMPKIKHPIYLDSYMHVKEAILAGMGNGVLPRNLIDPYSPLKILHEKPIFKKDIFLIYRKQKRADSLNILIDFCKNTFGQS